MVKKLPPVHPGEVLREDFLRPMKLTAYAVAKAVGVPRTRIERHSMISSVRSTTSVRS